MKTRKRAANRRIPDLRLKIAIIESGRTQRRLALDTRLGESRLSEIVGRREMPPSRVEMERIARVLARPIDDLFDVEAAIEERAS